jgi:hypothetical protein
MVAKDTQLRGDHHQAQVAGAGVEHVHDARRGAATPRSGASWAVAGATLGVASTALA